MFGSRSRRTSPESSPEDLSISQNLMNIGGSLSTPELLRAYRTGSFPWTVHPVTWWSPDPRAIIEFQKSVAKVILNEATALGKQLFQLLAILLLLFGEGLLKKLLVFLCVVA